MPEIRTPISIPLTNKITNSISRVFLLRAAFAASSMSQFSQLKLHYKEVRCAGGLAVAHNNMFYDERLDLGQVSLLARCVL